MTYILVFILSVVTLFAFMPLVKKTKLPLTVYLLVFGIAFGQYGLLNLVGEGNILGLDDFTTTMASIAGIAIYLLFLNSGIGLDLDSIKKSGKEVIQMSIIPVHVEGFILSIVAFVLLTVVFPDLGYASIPFFAFLIVMLIGAMSSPVIVIPEALTAKAEGKKSRIFDNMIIATIVDAFTPFPAIIISLVLLITTVNGSSDMSIPVLVLIAIAGCFVAAGLGFVVGTVFGKVIAKTSSVEEVQKNWILVLIMNVVSVVVVLVSGPLSALGILTTVGIGIGVNKQLTPEFKTNILMKSQKIFGMLFFPIVFIFVGSQVQVSQLLDPIMIFVLVAITFIAPVVKGQVTRLILKKNGYTKQEQKYADHAFFLKGIVLINMAVLIGPLFIDLGLDAAVQFLYLLAAVEVIITIPFGTVRLTKERVNWVNE
ncbi:cation:proton antiporter [Mollicutes bacterium LVI A0039]|nr:cation:proton antiporter [Mollicutes bacterium LVI A0039]